MRENDNDYTNYYEINEVIKQEEISTIYKAKNREKNEIKALKVYDMNDLSQYIFNSKGSFPTEDDIKRYIDGFKNQIKFMEILQGQSRDNQNSLIFDDFFETEQQFVIVMELCDCNLFNYILENKKEQEGLDSEEIYDILNQLNNNFEIMAQNKILHRNLRIENILIKREKQERSQYIVKLKFTDDCCFSKDSNELSAERINNDCKIYAPEVLKKGEYTEKSDLWSLGVLIYLLHFRIYPFIGNNKEEVLKNISNYNNEELEKTDDKQLDDLIGKLLVIEPDKRLNWEEYLDHPFFLENPKNNYENFYKKGRKIGGGAFGEVYEATKIDTGEKRGLKIIDKNNLMPYEDGNNTISSMIRNYKKEIRYMRIVEGKNKDNKNALKLYEYFDMKNELVIVIELCEKNLEEYLKTKKTSFNSKEIYDLLNQLNNTFKIMKENKIVHRDLKLSNILISTENNQIIYKLIDYGVSKQIPRTTYSMESRVGTSYFIAPEIMEGKTFKANCDLWSLGVIIYYLYFKDYPYKGMTEVALLEQIKLGNRALRKTDNTNLNDLISKLLVADPEKRISWEDYFNHPFLNN